MSIECVEVEGVLLVFFGDAKTQSLRSSEVRLRLLQFLIIVFATGGGKKSSVSVEEDEDPPSDSGEEGLSGSKHQVFLNEQQPSCSREDGGEKAIILETRQVEEHTVVFIAHETFYWSNHVRNRTWALDVFSTLQ